MQLTGAGLGSNPGLVISTCFHDLSGPHPLFHESLTREGDPIVAGLPALYTPPPKAVSSQGWAQRSLSPGLAVSTPPHPQPCPPPPLPPSGWLASAAPWLPPWPGPSDPTIYDPKAPSRAQPGILQTGSPNCPLSENQS